MLELNDNIVKMLVSVLTATGSPVMREREKTTLEPSMHDLRPYSLRPASMTQSPLNLQSSWVNNVRLGFEVSPVYVEQPPLLPDSTRGTVSRSGTPAGGWDLRGDKPDSIEQLMGSFLKVDFKFSKGTGTHVAAKLSR